jgi:hypothetical protein
MMMKSASVQHVVTADEEGSLGDIVEEKGPVETEPYGDDDDDDDDDKNDDEAMVTTTTTTRHTRQHTNRKTVAMQNAVNKVNEAERQEMLAIEHMSYKETFHVDLWRLITTSVLFTLAVAITITTFYFLDQEIKKTLTLP